jgi:hypothetical protein
MTKFNLSEAAKAILEGSKETFDANIASKKGMRGQAGNKPEVGEDKLPTSIVAGQQDVGEIGRSPEEMDDDLPDYTKGTPSATPPGATPPVGAQPGSKLTGQPQETMGRSDIAHPAQSAATDYSAIRDRIMGKLAPQMMHANPGATFQSYGEEVEYSGEQLDELSKDSLNTYLHKGVSKFKQNAAKMSSSEKQKKVAHLQKAHSKLKAKGGKFEEYELDDYLEMFAEEKDDEKMEKKKMMHDKMKEDVDALLDGENLSEEFKVKAATIFEAAVLSRAEEVITEAENELMEEFELVVEGLKEDMATKVDDYLNYMVEEWMKENEIAIEKGLRAEIVEDFIGGLRDLFVEHYIDIPEDKVDVVEELTDKVQELEDALNEQINRGVILAKEINEHRKLEAIYTACEGLTQTQVEKMKSLAENVDFTTESEFNSKLNVLKESYFKSEVVVGTSSTLNEGVEVEEEKKSSKASSDPTMDQYVKSISQTLVK